jgi:hypothetical protein
MKLLKKIRCRLFGCKISECDIFVINYNVFYNSVVSRGGKDDKGVHLNSTCYVCRKKYNVELGYKFKEVKLF